MDRDPDSGLQLSYEDEIVRLFVGTTTVPTPYERAVLVRHGVQCRCQDCDEWFKGTSIWGLCGRCENERLGDVVAG